MVSGASAVEVNDEDMRPDDVREILCGTTFAPAVVAATVLARKIPALSTDAVVPVGFDTSTCRQKSQSTFQLVRRSTIHLSNTSNTAKKFRDTGCAQIDTRK